MNPSPMTTAERELTPETLDAIEEMADTVAIKGELLRQLIAQARAGAPREPTEIADAVRKSFSDAYQRALDENDPGWQGNIHWARLEGAASVVKALRDVSPPGPSDEANQGALPEINSMDKPTLANGLRYPLDPEKI